MRLNSSPGSVVWDDDRSAVDPVRGALSHRVVGGLSTAALVGRAA
jgi:hypothetical protein